MGGRLPLVIFNVIEGGALGKSLPTFASCSLGLTGFDSKMNGTASKPGIEQHLVKKLFKIVTGETSYALAA